MSSAELPAGQTMLDRLMAGRKTLRGPIPAPESWWPEIPEIYARPYTLEHEQQIAPLIAKDDQRAYADIVARHARNAEGELLFRPANRAELARGALAEDVKRVALWIMGRGDEPDPSLLAIEGN